MTKTFRAALPLAALLCAPSIALGAPAASAPHDEEVIVTASPRQIALAAWSQRVERDLVSNMSPSGLYNYKDGLAEGLVVVGFACGESGMADKVTLLQSSGNRRLDRAALRAVRRVSTLHPVVEGMRPDQKLVAQMLYLNDSGSRRDIAQREQELRADAKERNAWFADQPEIASAIASGDVLVLAAVR